MTNRPRMEQHWPVADCDEAERMNFNSEEKHLLKKNV
jgi:hypothetical protein